MAEKVVITFDTEEEDDWIRSPQVTQDHISDKELFEQMKAKRKIKVTPSPLTKAEFKEEEHPRKHGEFAPKGTGDGGVTASGTAPATATVAQDAKSAGRYAIPGHERISGILGPRLTVNNSSSPAVQEHLQHLALLPDHMLTKLRAAGAQFFVGEGGVPQLDSMDHLEGVQPRGWPPGKTWDNVDGAYVDGKVIIGNAGTAHGTKSIALHETGHMIGEKFGYDDAPELIAFHQQLYPHLPPYLQQDGPGGKAGRQEFFAEGIVRRAMGAEAKSPEFKEFFNWIDNILAGKA